MWFLTPRGNVSSYPSFFHQAGTLFSKLSMRSRQQRPGVISGSAAELSNDSSSSSPWWCFLLSVCLLCLLCFKCTSRQQRTPCWTHFLRSIEEMFVGGPLAILVSPFSSLYSSVCFSEFFARPSEWPLIASSSICLECLGHSRNLQSSLQFRLIFFKLLAKSSLSHYLRSFAFNGQSSSQTFIKRWRN